MKVILQNHPSSCQTKELEFPYLMKSDIDGEIVLVTGRHKTMDEDFFIGTSVTKKPGYFSETWQASVFKKYDGKVVLEND